MPRVAWPASPDGRYRIDVSPAGLLFAVMVDTGVVDPLHAIGFDLEAGDYDLLRRAGRLSRFKIRSRRDASGRVTNAESAECSAQLFDPNVRAPVGPLLNVRVSRGPAGVVSRVGVVFFHKLTGCRVDWDLGARTWRVEYP